MSGDERWLLPEGIEEVLPPAARRLEELRRELLDLYDRWGYELVIPPLVEFLESLLTGTGNDLELQTFKLIDQASGRMLGVRADMTPQAARIDAHQLKRASPTRLCYLGTVLRTRGDGFGGSRSPLQVGAELYGHDGVESDLEVLSLMLETLKTAQVHDAHLDLGHVAIFRGLVRQAGLDASQEGVLFDCLQRKALVEIDGCLRDYALAPRIAEPLRALAELNGGVEVLAAARHALACAPDDVGAALAILERLSATIQRRWPRLPIHLDLGELRGYHYHTGALFAAYVPGQGQEIARGGRYDKIGEVFGRARPATGFSTDLKTLLALGAAKTAPLTAIYAPADDDPELDLLIDQLRAAKERVVRALPGAVSDPHTLGCDRLLVKHNQHWRVTHLDSDSRHDN